jgi:hypothetical protein
MEQGHNHDDVLACLGKAMEGFIIYDDPLVHVTGHGMCARTVSTTLYLLIELCAFLLELQSHFLDLLVLGFQLLHWHAWQGCYLPIGLIIEVICWGSLPLMDALDVPLGGTHHEAFTRGVMASPARVRAREQL